MRAALKRSAEEQKELEEEKIRESPLVSEKLESFEHSLRKGWSENRLAAPLFRFVGSYEELSEHPPSEAGWFGTDQWLPKDMFVPEPQVYGAEGIAHQFGFKLAEGEVKELVNKLSDSPHEGRNAAPFHEKVQATIDKMVRETYSPSVILAPSSWRLMRDMGIEGGPRRRNDPSTLEGIPSGGVRSNFRGRIEGVPVFELLHIPKDRVWIVDFAAFATWRQWFVDEEGEYLRIEFEVFDEKQAFALARENPNMLKSNGRESVPERAAAIRSLVYFMIRERFEIRLKDQKAARLLSVPEEPH